MVMVLLILAAGNEGFVGAPTTQNYSSCGNGNIKNDNNNKDNNNRNNSVNNKQ